MACQTEDVHLGVDVAGAGFHLRPRLFDGYEAAFTSGGSQVNLEIDVNGDRVFEKVNQLAYQAVWMEFLRS